MNKVLVTGTAGFIGFHLTKQLVADGYEVVGLDVVNDYYDVNLKYARLEYLGIRVNQLAKNCAVASDSWKNLRFIKADIADHEYMVNMMKSESFDYVINFPTRTLIRFQPDTTRLSRNLATSSRHHFLNCFFECYFLFIS